MKKAIPALRRAVRGYQPGFPDAGGFGAGNAQAGGFEIRPGLLRAIAANRVNVEPVGLGESLRHAGFDLWGKSGQNGEGGGDEGSDSHGGKSFDHDGPLSLGRFGPSFRWHLSNHPPFPDVFVGVVNGFVAPEFCFVTARAMKHATCPDRRADPASGSFLGLK
jgi:hypothetical protein